MEFYSEWRARGNEATLSLEEHIERKFLEETPRVERLAVEQTATGALKVKNDNASGRTIQQALNLLTAQPVGSAAETLIEAALKWAMVQRENALLRIENEDLKLRLRAAGVEIP